MHEVKYWGQWHKVRFTNYTIHAYRTGVYDVIIHTRAVVVCAADRIPAETEHAGPGRGGGEVDGVWWWCWWA